MSACHGSGCRDMQAMCASLSQRYVHGTNIAIIVSCINVVQLQLSGNESKTLIVCGCTLGNLLLFFFRSRYIPVHNGPQTDLVLYGLHFLVLSVRYVHDYSRLCSLNVLVQSNVPACSIAKRL